jgi:hypothetical protein
MPPKQKNLNFIINVKLQSNTATLQRSLLKMRKTFSLAAGGRKGVENITSDFLEHSKKSAVLYQQEDRK